jgi:uncharacterized coiled-coil DUF342 family protein
VKSRRGKRPSVNKGVKKYNVRISQTNTTRFNGQETFARSRKTREETTKSKRQVRRPNRLNEDLTKTILTTVIPPCAKERERIKRAYFRFRGARPHVKSKGTGGDRFTMRKCR